ncbi:DUF6270 domain-containing protein [Isoptericola sp. NPDC056578]|uniref:DUF6270 domain-containing protein n=1 Tax=Isoptericola sp. NPDC056578 TaxID=3345870 RepID=UPI003680EACB
MTKNRVFIYGSCVSRDAFEHFDPDRFELMQYVARQSALSAYTRPVTLIDPPKLESAFQQRMLSGDFESSLQAIVPQLSGQTDLVLVDLVDERLGAYVLPDGSVITRSVELVSTGAENDLPAGSQHLPFGSDLHFQYWSQGIASVGNLVRQHMPQAAVVLLDIPWASLDDTGTPAPDSFGLSAADANSLYPHYVKAAQTSLDAHVVSLGEHEVRAGSSHRWGPAPFHYSDNVYGYISETVERHIASRTPAAERTPAARRDPGAGRPAPARGNDSPPMPNLIIAGAHRAGTLWLYKQLARHQDIEMAPGKASNFFSRADVLSDKDAVEGYSAHFRDIRTSPWRGERTPTYFWQTTESGFGVPRPSTPHAIKQGLGRDVRILLSLRDPVTRAVSAFWHYVANGRAKVEEGIFRANPALGIVDIGFYERHYRHWRDALGEEALCTLLFDDLEDSPRKYLGSALDAIGADDYPEFWESPILARRYNHHPGIDAIRRARPVSTQEIVALAHLYERDIQFVQELTGRDLTEWHDIDTLIERNQAK